MMRMATRMLQIERHRQTSYGELCHFLRKGYRIGNYLSAHSEKGNDTEHDSLLEPPIHGGVEPLYLRVYTLRPVIEKDL